MISLKPVRKTGKTAIPKKRLSCQYKYTIIHDICHLFISFNFADAYAETSTTSDEPFA